MYKNPEKQVFYKAFAFIFPVLYCRFLFNIGYRRTLKTSSEVISFYYIYITVIIHICQICFKNTNSLLLYYITSGVSIIFRVLYEQKGHHFIIKYLKYYNDLKTPRDNNEKYIQ